MLWNAIYSIDTISECTHTERERDNESEREWVRSHKAKPWFFFIFCTHVCFRHNSQHPIENETKKMRSASHSQRTSTQTHTLRSNKMSNVWNLCYCCYFCCWFCCCCSAAVLLSLFTLLPLVIINCIASHRIVLLCFAFSVTVVLLLCMPGISLSLRLSFCSFSLCGYSTNCLACLFVCFISVISFFVVLLVVVLVNLSLYF